MKALVVVESSFGNTRDVAEAIAAGIGSEASVVDVAEAPIRLDSDVDLLVVGGPTHAFGMSRSRTREDATKQGGASGSRGIREWISGLARNSGSVVATFDTKIEGARRLPGSAARSAARALRGRGFVLVDQPQNFYVTGTTGPLAEGELQRAHTWGGDLAARAARQPH